MRVRRLVLSAAAAAALMAPATAAAAAPPPGGLIQIGCASAGGGGGCVAAPGLAGVSAVSVAEYEGVFATSPVDSAVVSLRDRTLQPLACVADQPTAGCSDGRALAGAIDVAATREFVYVVSRDADAVAAFRITEGGGLAQLPGEQGCVAMAVPGCAQAIALDEPVAALVTRTSLYVASRGSDAVAVFSLGSTGRLTQTGCVMQGPGAAAAGCAEGRALADPSDLAFEGSWLRPQGGEEVYVASSGSNGVALLRGASVDDCITEGGTEGCRIGRGLQGAAGIAVAWGRASGSDDVFVAAPGAGAVALLGGAPGALRQNGCLAVGGAHGCTSTAGLEGVRALALPPSSWYPLADAPDNGGSHLYTGGTEALGVFARDRWSGGALAPVLPTAQLAGAGSIVVTRDLSAQYTYAAVPGASSVVALARQMAPGCGSGWGPLPPPISVPGGTTTRVTIPACHDGNGDALSYSIETPPAHGTLGDVAADRTVAYTPAPGFQGDDAFTARASDGSGSALQAVRLVVGPVVDTLAPRVRILDRVVRFGPRRRAVLRLRADERCLAAVEIRRGGRRVARAAVTLPANRARRVVLRLTRRRAGRATVVVRARDAAGNARRATRRVRLRPR